MYQNRLSTLFVGIDVSLRHNVMCALNFNSETLLKATASNNQPGSQELVSKLLVQLQEKHFDRVVSDCESTSVYSSIFPTSCPPMSGFPTITPTFTALMQILLKTTKSPLSTPEKQMFTMPSSLPTLQE